MIANLYGPYEVRRHDSFILAESFRGANLS